MKLTPIRDLCSRISSGGTPSRKRDEYFSANYSGHLWVKSKELLDRSIATTEETITDEGLKKSAAKYFPAQTVLVAMYGANVCQLGWLANPATVNQAICGLVADENKADWRYLFYALLQERAKLVTKAQGAAQQNLNQDAIRDFELPVPDLSTQRKIAGILSAYDDLIENNLRRIKILEDMAQSLYREWFVHFRYPGHESAKFVDSPVGQIPKGWEVKKFGDIADISWGDTSTTKASYVEDGFAAYSASGLDGKLDHYDYDRVGIVLSAIGAQCGKTWLARGKWSCIKNTMRFWAKNDYVSTEFLFIISNGENFWPRRGAAQPFISQGDAQRIEILVPDPSTMKRFTQFSVSALEEIASLETKNQTLRRTRNLLLPKLLTPG